MAPVLRARRSPLSARPPVAAVAVAGAAVVWALLLALAPWLASHVPAGSAPFRAAAVVYVAGGTVCHQRVDRSFVLWGTPLPVCGRCTGLYASAAAGSVFGLVWMRRRGRPLGSPAWRWLLLAALAPTVASAGFEWAGLWTQSPLTRALAALPAGFVVAWFVTAHASEVAGRFRS